MTTLPAVYIVGAARTPIGSYLGAFANVPAPQPRRCRHPRRGRTRRARARRDRRSLHGQRAVRGDRPGASAPGSDFRRHSADRAGHDREQSVRLGPASGRLRNQDGSARRLAGGGSGRHGVDVERALLPARSTQRLSHGRRQAGRRHDLRRSVGSVQRLPHGQCRRAVRQGIPADPRGPGCVRDRELSPRPAGPADGRLCS